jgi:osmotically-inducible protein OsmY
MKATSLILSGVMALMLIGCSPEAKDDAGKAADNAKDAISKTAEDAKKSTDNAMMTGKVRSAINTANDVVIDELNVDTIDNTITLKGKAKDAKSKSTAEEIAKTQAGNDYKVDNQITVG